MKVTSQQAKESSKKPVSTFMYHGKSYDLSYDDKFVLMYDEKETAEELAKKFGTFAKHANAKHDNSHWKVFSIVRLPDETSE